MRFRYLIVAAGLVASSSLFANQTIEQVELDETLLQAQLAIEAREFDKAFDLYNQAAHWGHKGAQYVLGEMYLRGEGVEQNEIMGLAWLDVAAESRDRDFVRAHKKAAKSMSGADVEKADKVADKIAAAYGIDAAQMTCKREMRVGSNIKVTNCYHKRLSGDTILVPEEKGDFYASSDDTPASSNS
jgi:TPR repeat protein